MKFQVSITAVHTDGTRATITVDKESTDYAVDSDIVGTTNFRAKMLSVVNEWNRSALMTHGILWHYYLI